MPKGSQHSLRVFPPLSIACQSEKIPEKTETRLGLPLSIGQVAQLIGCSAWTVRQTLIPRGLPHFRFSAGGCLIFYRDQVVRWIEKDNETD
jgi:excisionase family DNA binding protein